MNIFVRKIDATEAGFEFEAVADGERVALGFNENHARILGEAELAERAEHESWQDRARHASPDTRNYWVSNPVTVRDFAAHGLIPIRVLFRGPGRATRNIVACTNATGERVAVIYHSDRSGTVIRTDKVVVPRCWR